MSSQASGDLGQNLSHCYFPWLPYYPRFQIGFDIIVNPSEAQADPSVAGESQRSIHVELFFPEGFVCNPAAFGGMPHPSFFGNGGPHLFPPHPHFFPPMFPGFPPVAPHFYPHAPMGFQGPLMWQGQHHSRIFVYMENSQPGEFMVIDGTPYYLIRPAASGITGQWDPARASARTANERSIYNAAPFGGIPHPPLFGNGVPPFFPPHPPFYPPMFPNFPHVSPNFNSVPMGSEGPMMRQENETPMLANSGNGQQGDFMVNADTSNFIIPQSNMRNEARREPEHIQNNPSQRLPSQMPHTQPGYSSQHPSTSGITGHRASAHTGPRLTKKRLPMINKSRL